MYERSGFAILVWARIIAPAFPTPGPHLALAPADHYASARRATGELAAAGYDGVISTQTLATNDARVPVTYRRPETRPGWAAPRESRPRARKIESTAPRVRGQQDRRTPA